MKTIYPQKQLSTADVEKMREHRRKKVLTSEDFKIKHDDAVDALVHGLQRFYRDSDIDPSDYNKWTDLDGTVYYMNKKTGYTMNESTYRSLVNKKEQVEDKKDMVNHPPHYNAGGFEVIDIIQAFTQDLNGIAAVDTANAIKYILRWHNKNGVEDLKKARWYIDHLIKKLEDFEDDK